MVGAGPGPGRRHPAKPKRTSQVVRRDGHGPLGLGPAIGLMMTERGMAGPAAGGTVLAAEDHLAGAAPELARHVQAADL